MSPQIAPQAEAPEEVALMMTIIDLVKNERCLSPTKISDSILSDVTTRLESKGFKPVSKFVIERRLKKLPLSPDELNGLSSRSTTSS
jgi:hypothetical protein